MVVVVMFMVMPVVNRRGKCRSRKRQRQCEHKQLFHDANSNNAGHAKLCKSGSLPHKFQFVILSGATEWSEVEGPAFPLTHGSTWILDHPLCA